MRPEDRIQQAPTAALQAERLNSGREPRKLYWLSLPQLPDESELAKIVPHIASGSPAADAGGEDGERMAETAVRHVLGVSGGKVSALAVYMRDRLPEREYYFCDTAKKGRSYSWSGSETFVELLTGTEVLRRHEEAMRRERSTRRNVPIELLGEVLDDEDDSQGCLARHL